ncbi:MAG: hypothetical protein JXR83_01855 [Deltaproteobacteria bacterium]|nr:hypothetical protein [Deltaproteobacteria bacterium]
MSRATAILTASALASCGLFPAPTGSTTCRADEDCPTGYRCQEQLCRVLDAGAADAAVADGQPGDAALDRAIADAGPGVDRVPLDARADAGSDGATPDALPCSFDAGPLDVPFSFAPVMAKRLTNAYDGGGGPFRVAPLIQAIAEGRCSRGDAIVANVGTRIGGTFFERFDPSQGTIVFWATPEWDIDDLSDATRHFLRAGDFRFGVDGPTRGVFVQIGNARLSFEDSMAGWRAGSTHFVALRWSRQTNFNAAFRVALDVDGAEQLGFEGALPVATVDTPLVVGAFDPSGLGAIGASIEGLTIYRRPLSSSSGGIDVGDGDEIGAIHSAGVGREPTQVTGSWGVVFALPTDARDVALVSPTDASQAFSHPHGKNLLPDGFLLTDDQRRRWSPIGDSTIQPATGDEAVFGGGVRVTTEARREGIGIDFNNRDNRSLVVRALVHSDGTSAVRLRLDAVADELFHIDGTTGSRRDRPDVLIATAEVATNTRLHLELVNTSDAHSTFFVHQVEVLPNMLPNPSFETGSGPDPEWNPDGWLNENPSSLRTYPELTTVHSGGTSAGIDGAGGQAYMDIRVVREPAGFDKLGDFFATGAFFWTLNNHNHVIRPDNGCLMRLAHPIDKFRVEVPSVAHIWQHLRGVGRRHHLPSEVAVNCSQNRNFLRFGGNWNSTTEVLVDDAYLIHLDRVPLQVRPADLSHSLTADALRVDGRDLVWQPVSALTVGSGSISVRIGRPHPPSTDRLFCPYGRVLFELGALWSDHITLRSHSDGQVRFDADIQTISCDEVHTQNLLGDGRLHRFDVVYDSLGDLTLSIDGVVKSRCQLAGSTWESVPQQINYGDGANHVEHCDVWVGREGAVFGGQ